MKIRFSGSYPATQMLASVPFNRFAGDSDGKVYFASNEVWYVGEADGSIRRVGSNSFATPVTLLPKGSEIILSSDD